MARYGSRGIVRFVMLRFGVDRQSRFVGFLRVKAVHVMARLVTAVMARSVMFSQGVA